MESTRGLLRKTHAITTFVGGCGTARVFNSSSIQLLEGWP